MLLSESLSQKERSAWLETSAALAVESLAKHLAGASGRNGLESNLQQRGSLVAEAVHSQPHSHNHLCRQLGLDFLQDFQAHQT